MTDVLTLDTPARSSTPRDKLSLFCLLADIDPEVGAIGSQSTVVNEAGANARRLAQARRYAAKLKMPFESFEAQYESFRRTWIKPPQRLTSASCHHRRVATRTRP